MNVKSIRFGVTTFAKIVLDQVYNIVGFAEALESRHWGMNFDRVFCVLVTVKV